MSPRSTHTNFRRSPHSLVAGLVVFLLAAVLAGSLVWRLEQYRLEQSRARVADTAGDHAYALQRNIEHGLSAAQVLDTLVRQGRGTVANFDEVAGHMLPLYPGVAELALAPGGIIRKVVPLAGNEKALGFDLLHDPAQRKEAFLARDTAKLTLAGPLNLIQGGVGVVGRLPVFLDDAQGKPYFWGFALVVMRVPATMEAARVADLTEQGFAWELSRMHPDGRQKQIIAASSSAALNEPVQEVFSVPNAAWTLSVMPAKGWGDPPGLSLKVALGLLFSLLLGYLAMLLVESKAHEKGLEALVAERTAEVRAHEADLNRAQSIAQVGSWVLDLATKELRGSAETLRILGLSGSGPINYKAFLKLVHPDDRNAVDRAARASLKGERYDIEYRIVAGAATRWVHSQAELKFDADGKLSNALGTIQDITERKQREHDLWRFRAAMDATADAIYLVDRASMRFIDINAAACAMRGQAREEMIALGPEGVLSTSRAELERTYDSVIAGDAATEPVEMLRQRKDGREVWLELRRRALRSHEGWTIVTVVRDITERKRAEEVLLATEEQFRSLVEQAIAGIYIIQDNKFAYVNPRLAEILGYDSAEELIGKDALSVVADEDRAMVTENIRLRLEGHVRSISFGFSGVRKDGTKTEIGVHGARATHGGRPAIIGLLQDISEKKRAEEQIQTYLKQLETAFMSTVEVATTLGEMRDPYTAGHQHRVAEIAVAIGAELGFDARRQEGLRVAGYLHDIGKITIPAEILSKPGKLTPLEFTLIQGHAQSSYDVLKDVDFPWLVAEVALQHHERMDGSGYPRGLKGDAILLEARIMAVADVMEAMSSHRPYRPGLGIDKALAEIERGRGSAYDAEVSDACLRMFREQRYKLPA
jgi:PAS domain S-box-containing protein